jgi:cyanobactin maturation PatA/PatG family protease
MTTKLAELPGMRDLWAETLGDPRIRIAVLDGPIDRGHPCFVGAELSGLETRLSDAVDGGRMSTHGTHVASVIFGEPGSPVHGIAPKCSGLLAVIYSDRNQGPTSQMDLAHAIHQAVQAGAQVVNISGGELSNTGRADPMLVEAVRHCQDRGVLIVAAAGNDACQCLHVPAALPSVLAVGAMDENGWPLDSSNWGDAYQSQGVLAPGHNILGARPGGGTALKSGTSYATPIVTGIAALLLSWQLARGEKPDPLAVGRAILAGATPCNEQLAADCRRFLAGHLDIPGARALISKQRSFAMSVEQNVGAVNAASDSVELGSRTQSGVTAQHEPEATCISEVQPSHELPAVPPAAADQASQNSSEASFPRGSMATVAPASNGARATRITPSVAPRASSVTASCGCNGKGGRSLVYALGTLGYDFGTEARRDGFKGLMPSVTGTSDGGLIPFIEQEDVTPDVPPYPPNPYDPRQLGYGPQ